MTALRIGILALLAANVVLAGIRLVPVLGVSVSPRILRSAGRFFAYEVLLIVSFFMLLPFYWMVVSSFKDSETALRFPPDFTPTHVRRTAPNPATGERVPVRLLEFQRQRGQEIRVVPESEIHFREVDMGSYAITREEPEEDSVFLIDPGLIEESLVMKLDGRNFVRAWFAPEQATRGAVNFGRYFWVSLVTGIFCTLGTLLTSALAAYAFAKMPFRGRGLFFGIVLVTMMVPGQVLLIPNFLTLGSLGWLDTYLALIVPFLASVFTIFLMRQFFMTIPDALWDAAQIDGSGRFRFLWQVVVPLSKPVFLTAGIFIFLGSWNALLWPLIVTSSPEMRTLMVGLQTFDQEAGTEYELMMAAATMAILPVIVLFFLLQRYFIQGIARTGLK